jgi:hypothetical protein
MDGSITFVAKTAMFDNGVTQCPCPLQCLDQVRSIFSNIP